MRIQPLGFALLLLTSPLFPACSGSSGGDDDTSYPTEAAGDDDDATVTDGDHDGYLPPDDCDDNNSQIYPGAEERCNDRDDNCDGSIDGEDSVNPTTFYVDADSDGYGDPGNTVEACDLPEGYIATGDDCDDTDADVNPTATEVCGDGVDNNCDGSGAGCGIAGQISLSAADVVLEGIAASDRAGVSVASAGDVDGDGLPDILVGATSDDTGGTGAGAAYLILATDLSSPFSLTNATARFIGEEDYAYAGDAVAGAGDVNGDGFADILVGAPYVDVTLINEDGEEFDGISAGAAYLIYGPVTGQINLADADVRFTGESAGELAGGAISSAGDVNGDGYDDVLIGAWSDDLNAADAGAAYLFYGPVSPGTISLADADAKLAGSENPGQMAYQSAGKSVAGVGDVNGDRYDDILVGAPGYQLPDSDTSSDNGAAYLFYGPISGDLTLDEADATLYSEQSEAQAGSVVAPAGDVNGDGLDDVLVSAPFADGSTASTVDAGAVYVLYGPLAGLLGLSAADARLTGESISNQAGYSASSAGDVNNDGFADILVGAQGDTSLPGDPKRVVYVVYGPVDGTLSLAEAGAVISADDPAVYLGYAVAPAGDIDQDGYDDILAGVPDNGDDSDFAGAAYLFKGQPAL